MDKEYGVSLGDDEKVPKLKSGDGCTTLRINLKPVNCVCYMGELSGTAIASQRSCLKSNGHRK